MRAREVYAAEICAGLVSVRELEDFLSMSASQQQELCTRACVDYLEVQCHGLRLAAQLGIGDQDFGQRVLGLVQGRYLQHQIDRLHTCSAPCLWAAYLIARLDQSLGRQDVIQLAASSNWTDRAISGWLITFQRISEDAELSAVREQLKQDSFRDENGRYLVRLTVGA